MADLKLLRKVFDNLDLDKNETLSLDEVQMGLHKLGFTLSLDEINEQLFQIMDRNKNGKITFKDFVKFVDNRNKEFKEIFMDISKTYSTDYMYNDDDLFFKPTISSSDIRSFINQYKIKATDKQISTFLDLIDDDSQGVISFEEFQAFFALLPRANPAAVFEAFKYTTIYEHANDLYKIIYQYSLFHLNPKFEELRLPRQVGRDDGNSYNLYKLGSGAIAGFISRTVTAPFDRLRMMMQFKDPGSEKLGFWGGLKEIYLKDGFKGYFKGNGINCMKKVPEIAIKFYVFDFLLEQFSFKKHTTSMLERILSGGIAGGVGQFLVYPMEIARVRFALAPTGYYTSFFDCIHKIVKQEGITKLYSGLTPTLIGIFPYAGIDIGVYSFIKLQYCQYYQGQNKEPTIGNLLFSGMVASAIAMVATAPINIVRTRLQGNGLLPVHKRYHGPIDAAVRTFKKEGIQGFYRGTWPALIKVMPATSISYIVYEKLNQLVQHKSQAYAEAV